MPYGDVMLNVKPNFYPWIIQLLLEDCCTNARKSYHIKVKKGKKVKAGDTLVILEAMKMEHSIKSFRRWSCFRTFNIDK